MKKGLLIGLHDFLPFGGDLGPAAGHEGAAPGHNPGMWGITQLTDAGQLCCILTILDTREPGFLFLEVSGNEGRGFGVADEDELNLVFLHLLLLLYQTGHHIIWCGMEHRGIQVDVIVCLGAGFAIGEFHFFERLADTRFAVIPQDGVFADGFLLPAADDGAVAALDDCAVCLHDGGIGDTVGRGKLGKGGSFHEAGEAGTVFFKKAFGFVHCLVMAQQDEFDLSALLHLIVSFGNGGHFHIARAAPGGGSEEDEVLRIQIGCGVVKEGVAFQFGTHHALCRRGFLSLCFVLFGFPGLLFLFADLFSGVGVYNGAGI